MSVREREVLSASTSTAAGDAVAADNGLDAGASRILEALVRHRARGIFFIVGELAVEHPDRLTKFERVLAQAMCAIQNVTGRGPIGFRAPYLLAPQLYNPRIVGILAAHGYRWTSNRELGHAVELPRPDRLRTERPWRFVTSHPELLDRPRRFSLQHSTRTCARLLAPHARSSSPTGGSGRDGRSTGARCSRSRPTPRSTATTCWGARHLTPKRRRDCSSTCGTRSRGR